MRILSYLLISATAASVALAGEQLLSPRPRPHHGGNGTMRRAIGSAFARRSRIAAWTSPASISRRCGATQPVDNKPAPSTPGCCNSVPRSDLEKLVGWRGATFNTTWLWLSGKDISGEDVGNFLTVSNIAGFNTFRALDIWLEQELFDDKLAIRAGQMTADSEFVISDYGSLFSQRHLRLAGVSLHKRPRRRPRIPDGHARCARGVSPIRLGDGPERRLSGKCFRAECEPPRVPLGPECEGGIFLDQRIPGPVESQRRKRGIARTGKARRLVPDGRHVGSVFRQRGILSPTRGKRGPAQAPVEFWRVRHRRPDALPRSLFRKSRARMQNRP